MSVRVSDVVAAIAEAFPIERAEAWDAVGLLVGDPDARVERVLVSLDPTLSALERACEVDAQVLVTHHPVFLTPPAALTPQEAPVAFAAASRGVALVAAHTNLDRAPAGATALARILGIDEGEPLEDLLLPVSVVTIYAPAEYEGRLKTAMTEAGAGRIGEYRGCSFTGEGTGGFTPSETSEPVVGIAGHASSAPELRIEMIAPRHGVALVVQAARAAHPYEEPLITVTETEIARGSARMGRVSRLEYPTTLTLFAQAAAKTFGVTPRVWGDSETAISVVATATGSAGSLVRPAISRGADVLLAGEVRYHDALAAVEFGLAVVEVGHDASEWPLVEVLARAVRKTPGLTPECVIAESQPCAWWTP